MAAAFPTDIPEEKLPSADHNLYASAIQLWESEPLKSKIVYYFGLQWCDIEELILHHANRVSHDNEKRREMKNCIYVIGRKIFHWAKYVIFELGLEAKQVEKIYWTSDGCIDKTKILKLFWSDCKELSSLKKKIDQDGALINIACLFGQADFTGINAEVMAKRIKSLTSVEPKSGEPPDYVELFFLSISNGLDNAVEYFANLIEMDNSLLDKAVNNCIEKCISVVDDYYLKENLVRIFLFLFNKLSDDKKCELFLEKPDNIFKIFLNVWPYEERCVEILKTVLDRLEEYKIFNLHVLKTFFKQRSLKGKVLVGQPTHLKIFEMLFGKLGKSYKKFLFVGRYVGDDKTITVNLYNELDFPILKLIINDEELSSDRKSLICSGREAFKTALKNGNMSVLLDFEQTVLVSDQDVKDFRMNFHSVLYSLVEDQKCPENFMRDLMDWLAPVKRPFDLVRLCCKYTKACKSPENFSQWCSKVGKRSNYRDEVKDFKGLDSALREGFCEIWCSHRNCNRYAMNLCTDFLLNFLEPDDVRDFRRNKLVENEEFVKIFCSYLIRPEDFWSINNLIDYCGVPDEKVKSIMRNMISNPNWVNHFGEEGKSILVLDVVLHWLFGDTEEKDVFIHFFLNSPQGAKFTVDVLKKDYKRYLTDETCTFLHKWLKRCNDINDLKFEITRINCDDGLREYVLSLVNAAFGPERAKPNKQLTAEACNKLVAKDDEGFGPAQVFLGDNDLALEFALLLDAEETKMKNNKTSDSFEFLENDFDYFYETDGDSSSDDDCNSNSDTN